MAKVSLRNHDGVFVTSMGWFLVPSGNWIHWNSLFRTIWLKKAIQGSQKSHDLGGKCRARSGIEPVLLSSCHCLWGNVNQPAPFSFGGHVLLVFLSSIRLPFSNWGKIDKESRDHHGAALSQRTVRPLRSLHFPKLLPQKLPQQT